MAPTSNIINTSTATTEIGASLEHDPELMYFTWKVNVQNRAANMATIVDRTGLLSLILSDDEWAAYAPNRVVAPNGTIAVTPRPQPPVHIPIVNGMTNAQIAVAKYSNDRHATWHEAQETFKELLIRSLGPTLEGTLGPPPDGFTLLSVQKIVAAVKDKYGTVDQMALSKMEDILTSPLDHVQNLDKHLAHLKQHMMIQIAAGYRIEEYRKVSIFKRSVIGHHQIAQCIQDFDKEFTDPLANTYDQITTYVTKRLPTIRAAAELSASVTTGRAFATTTTYDQGRVGTTTTGAATTSMSLAELQCAYSVLEYKHKNLQSNQKRQGNNKQKQGGKKQKEEAPSKPGMTHYCYAHGTQGSHTSAQCKVMASQPHNFTVEMRKATNPNQPSGGSTFVRGQAQ